VRGISEGRITMRGSVLGLIVCLMLGGGCGYYRIQEPSGGPEYYTKEMSVRQGWNGAIGFRDYRTGDHVVLQQHQSRKITKEEFEEAVSSPAPPTASYTGQYKSR
jgi:hypothetical protein